MAIVEFTAPKCAAYRPRFGEEILVYGNRLCSTHCRELPYEDLCKPAYLVVVYHVTIVAIGHGL
mgnify:CR=1 FL=1